MNEILCKVLAHNLCCLVQSIYELGIEPSFWQPQSRNLSTRMRHRFIKFTERFVRSWHLPLHRRERRREGRASRAAESAARSQRAWAC